MDVGEGELMGRGGWFFNNNNNKMVIKPQGGREVGSLFVELNKNKACYVCRLIYRGRQTSTHTF